MTGCSEKTQKAMYMRWAVTFTPSLGKPLFSTFPTAECRVKALNSDLRFYEDSIIHIFLNSFGHWYSLKPSAPIFSMEDGD